MGKKPPTLSFDDAVSVWLMRWAGTYQHDIAAHFGINQGRVSEILTGKRFTGSEAKARKVV